MKNLAEKLGLRFFLGTCLAFLGIIPASNSMADPSSYVTNAVNGGQILGGHVPLEVKNGTAVFKSHASLNITGQIIMPLQNQAQLSNLLANIYNPKSPYFHQFLTPAQFAQQFHASAVNSTLVQEYLQKEGITVIGESANGAVLNVSGPTEAFERAFNLNINFYQGGDGAMFFAPSAEPRVPATLANMVLAVGGLDNRAKYQAHRFHTMAAPKTGTGPGGFLAPSDVKTAYNLNSLPSNGAGQSVAVFELDGYASKDIAAYESQFKLPNVPLQNVLVGGFNGVPNYGSNGGADEVTLDIELMTAFAPGSSNIYVYEAPNTTSAWIAEWTKIANDNKAKVISCSWGEPEADSPTNNFDNQIFQQMAAQGQAVFVAAGDNGAYDAGGSVLGVDEPASQPYATGVGISKLTFGSNETYGSEAASIYGGGGVSAIWSIPSYQLTMATQAVKAAKVSTAMRNVPDVALTADASTAYSFYINGSWAGYYGSSIAAPIWASFMSCVNQGLGKNAPVGSVNAALYQLAQNAGSYANDFHDISNANSNNGYYPAEPGFDDATGLGSFNGLNLYNDLVKTSVAVTPPAVPTGLNAVAGNAQVSLSWAASSGAASYDVKRSTVSGGPYTTLATGVLNLTYTDTSSANGTPYYYVVSAVNSGGQSANSIQVSATPQAPKAPAAVTNLKGSATNYGRQPAVLLQWTQSSGLNIIRNNVYRSTGSASPVYYGSIFPTSAVYDLGVINGVTYNYYVTAVNNSGVESPISNKITVVMPTK